MGYTLSLSTAVGGGATVANALAGTAIEYMGEDAMLDIYANGDITGMSFALTGYKGSSPGEALIPAGSSLFVASTVGKVKINEDFIASVPIPGGTRLVLPITNPGAASNARFQFVVH